PAADNSHQDGMSTRSSEYAEHAWTRDESIVAIALRRGGLEEASAAVVENLLGFYADSAQRNRFVKYVLTDTATAKEWYAKGIHIPHIKAKIENGKMVPFEQWGHQQLDAMGMWLWTTFRSANVGLVDLHELNERFASEINPNEANDSVLGLAIKFLNRIEYWDQDDFGPWEDKMFRKRGTSVGICVAALEKAQQFFESHPHRYNALPNGPDSEAHIYLKLELENAIFHGRRALEERVPKDGRLAVENDRWQSDAALTFLLYPFSPTLEPAQESALLRRIFERDKSGQFCRIGELGISRRGEDDYVGQDYIYNPGGNGIFADMNTPGYKPAEWTLFDGLLCGYFARRYINSVREGGLPKEDTLSLLYAKRFFRRMASQFTKEDDQFTLAADGTTISTNKGVIPEAFFWDSKEERWRANHNTPLLMANAAHALALERMVHALAMHEALHRR
ncbi:MAG: hypothetical protein KDD70_18495, partial [Bdellovibrionales bacterium]|nr:hypothetical protein [Bdellovibrionales bacterium]